MDDVPLQSASQVELGTQCERKWGFKYLDHVQVPTHPGALLGTEVQDEQIDPYLRGERPSFDFTRKSGEIAQRIVPLLPPPLSPGVVLRRKFLIPSPTGRFAWRGEYDLWAPDSVVLPGLNAFGVAFGGYSLIEDTKTTGNLDYAKNAETLKKDIQAQLYATSIIFLENVEELDLVWVTGQTVKPHRVIRSHLAVRSSNPSGSKYVISPSQVIERFQELDASGDRLTAIKQAHPKVSELRPNPRMCNAFGGCPYRHLCNLSPAVHAAAINQESVDMNTPKTTNFLDSLRKAAPQVAAPVAPAAPAPAPAPVPVPVVAPPGHFIVHAAGPESTLQPGVHPFSVGAPTAPVPALSPVQAAVVAQAQAQGVPAGEFVPTGLPPSMRAPAPVVAINPPESALPPAPPVGAAAPATEKPKRGRPAKAADAPANEPASDGPTLEAVPDLAAFMRANGVKRLGFDGAQVTEIEVQP